MSREENNFVNMMHERARWMKARWEREAGDVWRSINWNFRGGRRFFRRYSPDIIAGHKWCFIVGCNNSGTSILHTTLDRTGQVSTLPFEGQRYTNALHRAHRKGHERVWTEFLSDLRMDERHSLECIPRVMHDWMREFGLPIHELIVEKTTANAVRMLWLQKAFPDSYFIGLIRNGYAVTEGIMRKGNKSAERGARHWNTVNRIMIEDASKIDRFMELRYEDIVDNPHETAGRLSKFLGVSLARLQKAMSQDFSFTTIDGSAPKPIVNMNSKSISKLKEEEIEKIHSEAAEMLGYFGYQSTI